MLGHGNEHVVVIQHVFLGGIPQAHVRHDAENEGGQTEVEFAESKTVGITLVTNIHSSMEKLETYFMPRQARLPFEKDSMLRSRSFLRWLFSSSQRSGEKENESGKARSLWCVI